MSLALHIAAIVCFVLVTFGATIGTIALLPLGLAFFAAGHIIP